MILTRIFGFALAIMLVCSICAVLFYSLVSYIYPLDADDIRAVVSESKTIEDSISLYDATQPESIGEQKPIERFILSLVPSNIYQSLVIEQLPALIFFAVLLGIVISIIRSASIGTLAGIIQSLNLSFQKIFRWLMYFLPLTLLFLTAQYVQQVNFAVFRTVLFSLLIFMGVFVVSLVIALLVFMKRRETNFLTAAKQLLYPAVLGISANNHIVALPEALHVFSAPQGDAPLDASGTVVSILFSLNNIGYFLFLNIFALISMLISAVPITPISLGAVFVTSLLLSLTSSISMTQATTATEQNSWFFSLLGSIGIITHFTSGYWLIIFSLLRPLQVFYSVLMNIFISAIVLPKPSREAILVAEIEEQDDFAIADDFAIDDLSGFNEMDYPSSVEISAEKIDSAVAPVVSEMLLEEATVDTRSEHTQQSSRKKIFAIPFRTSVVILTTVLIIFYGFLSNVINYSGSMVSLYSLADTFLDNLTNDASSKIKNYLELPLRTLHDINVFINNKGMFDDNEETVKFIYEIMEGQPEFTALYYGSSDGTFRMVKRMTDGSFSIRRVEQSATDIISRWEHENQDYAPGFPDSVDSLENGYDPRRRVWYKAAEAGMGMTWSDVYTFSSDNQLGLTTAIPVYRDDGSLRGVFGIDIGLLTFSNFLQELKLGANGHAFVIEKQTKEFLAVSLPGNRAANDLYYYEEIDNINSIKRVNIDTTLSPYYNLAYKAYVNEQTVTKNSGPIFNFFQFLLGRLQTEPTNKENYSFTYQKDVYLASIRDLSPGQGIEWQLGLIMHVNSFMGGVNQNNSVILIFSLFLIVVVGFIGATIASKISGSITLLANEMGAVKDLKLENVAERKVSRIQEIQNMNIAFDGMLRGLLSFKKYVPADVVTQLIQMQGSAEIGGARQEITMLFSDIREFTVLSEQTEPEQLLERLEEYFDLFSNILLQANATIDKYIGDSIMAFWGAPVENTNHALHACHAAVQFQRELRRSHLLEQFYTRIGIHTGVPLVGNVGSSRRLSYTAIGDAVNLASRLENLNKYYGSGIIISETTYAQVQGSFEVRYLDNVAVKGKTQGLKIYEIIGDKGTVDLLQTSSETTQQVQQFLSLYNLGVRYYDERQWGKAVHYFARAYSMRKHDKSAKIMYLRCYNFYQSPPPSDWDGVVMFREK